LAKLRRVTIKHCYVRADHLLSFSNAEKDNTNNRLIIVDRKDFVKILFTLFLSQVSLAHHLVLLQVRGCIVKHNLSSLQDVASVGYG
jgi:hypothetical protein